MINSGKYIRQAYYDALSGVISVPVYKEDVPESEVGNHVVLRLEGDSDDSNKSSFNNVTTMLVDICTVGVNSIDPDTVEDIDGEIRAILLPTQGAILLADTIRVLVLRPESSNYVPEDDGTKRYYRKVTRWTQKISHL